MKTKVETSLVTSATSQEALLKQIQSYFYSPSISIQGEEVHNSNGVMKNFRVKHKARRWRLERITQQAN